MPKAIDTSTASGRLIAARFLSRYIFDKQAGKFYHVEDLPVSEFPTLKGYRIWKGKFSGKEAGTFTNTGYRTLRSIIDGEIYTISEHRAAFFFYHGSWPNHTIDHINGDRADNRKDNLRDVPQAVNARNKKKEIRNKSGHPGIFHEGRRYRAILKYQQKTILSKSFKTLEAAVKCRAEFIASHPEMGFSERHVMGA